MDELPLVVRATVAELFSSDAEVDLSRVVSDVTCTAAPVCKSGIDCLVSPTDSSRVDDSFPVWVHVQPGVTISMVE